MYEVEVKVRADHDAVRERLDTLDATPLGTVHQEDTYFDAPHRDFAETDEALRLRREAGEGAGGADPQHYLTYKGPLVDDASKSREEAESAVAEGEEVRDILNGVGFEPAATVSKERERYDVDGFTVTLDSVEGLGAFVEVEREAEDVDAAREGVFEILRRLGLDPADGIRTSYLGLLLVSDEGGGDPER